jgi:hypothetical protein
VLDGEHGGGVNVRDPIVTVEPFVNTIPFLLGNPIDKRRNILRATTKKPGSVPKNKRLTITNLL